MSLRVQKVEGEATRFHVESNSWCCTRCDATYNRKHRPKLQLGQQCPACLRRKDGRLKRAATLFGGKKWVHDENPDAPVGRLDHRWHLVDIAAFNLNGQCSCEYFCYAVGPQLRLLSPAAQGDAKLWCTHIAEARRFALDVALKAHEDARLGLREEEAA